jgi:hypothetical protein
MNDHNLFYAAKVAKETGRKYKKKALALLRSTRIAKKKENAAAKESRSINDRDEAPYWGFYRVRKEGLSYGL